MQSINNIKDLPQGRSSLATSFLLASAITRGLRKAVEKLIQTSPTEMTKTDMEGNIVGFLKMCETNFAELQLEAVK